METKNTLIAAGLLLAALSGCTGATEEQEIPLNSTWTLQSFGDIGSETPVIPGTEVTMQFIEAGRIAGSAGCNRYFSSYEEGPGGALSFGMIGSTEMYCEGTMDQEYRYLTALENVTSMELGPDGLKLYYDGGVLNFE
jgi:heat shock protein HslJ